MECEDECLIHQLQKVPFHRREYCEKKEIVAKGRPLPELPGLITPHKARGRNSFVRHFHSSEYEKVPWLTGSKLTNTLFCWPCLLFQNGKTPWTKEGISNLNALSTSVKKHGRSQNHILSQVQLVSFGSTRIELDLNEQQRLHVSRHNELVKQNREILKRLIDSVCHLAKLQAPFRGHDESSTSFNKGHYLELLTLIGSYDHLLKTHLETATVFRGTSNRLQNSLIEAVGQVVMDQIKEEVKCAPFVAILLDETTDVMNASQLSTVLRYVAQDGSVKERFVGFADVSADKSAAGLLAHVLQTVHDFQLSDKLVAQTYDGAAVMAGQLKGLCTRVQEKFPNALFIHCFAHRLNLLLQQVCMNIKEWRIFFLTLSGLAAYFSKSPKRSEELKAFMVKRLPRVAPTRWVFTSRLVHTVCEFQPQLIEFFDHLIENNPGELDIDASVKAQGFRSFLTNFHNTFLLAAFSHIFQHTDILYEIFQKIDSDISFCYRKVMETRAHLNDDRERFDTIWEEIITKSQACDIEEPRCRRRRGDDDDRTVTTKENSRRIYCEIIDTITVQLEDRFSSIERFKFFSLVDSQKFENFKTNFPVELFALLQDSYGELFDCSLLRSELIVIYSWVEFEKKNISELVEHMHNTGLHKVISQVYRLCLLILTIPSTTASVERSFSALKRIKTFIRATIGQERLSSLSLLAIEKEVLCNLKQTPDFYGKVIEVFAKQTRRMEFNFK